MNKATDDQDEMFKQYFKVQLPEDAVKIDETESVEKQIKKYEATWTNQQASQAQ